MQIEQLETNLAALKLLVSEHNEKSNDYNKQIADLEKQITDYNKPELTPKQLDAIYLAVEKAVEEFDFSDTDNFDIEYGIEYDGRVHCETHELNNTTDLVESICDKVTSLFKEVEEEPTAEQINKTTTDNS